MIPESRLWAWISRGRSSPRSGRIRGNSEGAYPRHIKSKESGRTFYFGHGYTVVDASSARGQGSRSYGRVTRSPGGISRAVPPVQRSQVQSILPQTASRPFAVVILPDSGSRYLSKFYDDKWMREFGFSPWSLVKRPWVTSCLQAEQGYAYCHSW